MTLPGFILGGMLFLLGIPAAFASLYLLAAALLSARPAAVPAGDRRVRFDVIVPAHNEAAGIARTVENLRNSLKNRGFPQTSSIASFPPAMAMFGPARQTESHW